MRSKLTKNRNDPHFITSMQSRRGLFHLLLSSLSSTLRSAALISSSSASTHIFRSEIPTRNDCRVGHRFPGFVLPVQTHHSYGVWSFWDSHRRLTVRYDVYDSLAVY